MKIALMVGRFPPRWLAGTEIATYNIAKYLAKKGHDIHVITSLDDGLPGRSLEQGFYVHRIGVPRARFLGIIVFWLRVLLRIRRLRPDLVQVQGIGMGVPAFLAKKLLGTPYIVWGRGTDVYLSWLFKKPISKLVLRNPDRVIALTEDMKKEIQKNYGRPVDVIPNGIDLESYEALPAKSAIRDKLGLDNDERIIVFVGTLRPVKGVKYLIEALDIIKRKDTTAKLMLVGDGEERHSLEGRVEELNLGSSVTFVGKVPNEKVTQYMAAADILVLPSLSEGFPNVALEAMAVGLPVVASMVGGLPELIEEGENGFLTEPKSPDQIADRTLLLLCDEQLRRRISMNNREKVKVYSWERVVDKVEEIYKKHVSGV